MTLRETLEQREAQMLCPYAARAAASRGRVRAEPEHAYRTAFQRDRDRILHCKAFRRLKRKTQVFLAPEGDHYRTRLTHTLEAAQIARTVARALCVNEDLTEAIALGHDLGHTPFGHAGEAVLDEVFRPEGFRHAEQSLRVVDRLESTRNGPGLNLTWEVRDGIVHHSKGKCLLDGGAGCQASTVEGRIVSVCDAIAYVNHDIDDALRAHMIALEDLPADAVARLGRTTSERINTMASAVIEASGEGRIGMTADVLDATNVLRDYLYAHFYPCADISREVVKAKRLLRGLYEHLIEQPLPEIAGKPGEDSLERRVVDFLAGMTDQYALKLYADLLFPAGWRA